MNAIRRKDRAIDEQEAIEILRKGEYGVLSMCTTDNEGYGIPLNYVLVENAIYFHCAVDGSKLDYLRKNNKVSFCVVGNTEVMPAKFGTLYESAIVFGETAEVDGNEKKEALLRIIEKYSAEYIPEGKDYIHTMLERVRVLRLTIHSVSAKARRT